MNQKQFVLTHDDISKATGGCINCPIARMLRRNGFVRAIVGYAHWRTYVESLRIPATPSMRLLIRKFDNNKPIRPCVVLVNMP